MIDSETQRVIDGFAGELDGVRIGGPDSAPTFLVLPRVEPGYVATIRPGHSTGAPSPDSLDVRAIMADEIGPAGQDALDTKIAWVMTRWDLSRAEAVRRLVRFAFECFGRPHTP